MHLDYWVKWIVAEQRSQERIQQARHQARLDMVDRDSKAGAGSPWWQTLMVNAAAAARGWMAEPATMAPSRATTSQLTAEEVFRAC